MNNTEKPKQPEASDAIIQITEHAHKEISWVRSYYRFTVTAVTLLIAVGIYFTFRSASEFKTEILQDGQRAQEIQKIDFASLEQKLRQDLQRNVDDMRKEVAKRIDAEFDSIHISELVRDKAKERIDAIADVLIQKDITNQITPIRTEFLNQLAQSKEEIRQRVDKLNEDSKQTQKDEAELHSTIIEARELLTKLDEQSVFLMTVISAQNDNEGAYEQLLNWAGDPKYPMHKMAESIVQAILINYYDPQNNKGFAVFDWSGISTNPKSLNIQEIQQIWTYRVPSSSAKSFVDNVYENTNITKAQKLSFFYFVIKKDSRNSLLAANRAANFLAYELKAKYNPSFNYSDIESKWAEWERTNSIPVTSTNSLLQPKP